MGKLNLKPGDIIYFCGAMKRIVEFNTVDGPVSVECNSIDFTPLVVLSVVKRFIDSDLYGIIPVYDTKKQMLIEETELLRLQERGIVNFSLADSEKILKGISSKILNIFKNAKKEIDKLKLKNKLLGDK